MMKPMKFSPKALWMLLPCILLTSCGIGGTRYNYSDSFASLTDIYEPSLPVVDASPYRGVLADCTINPERDLPCTLSTLPFIGQDSATVTVDSVMAHVVVSQPWMGQRFRQLLETLPPEVLQMMRPVTAIVITGKVRPSQYKAVTGALYIDPQNLWLTQEELSTIDKAPDYRDAYGNGMKVTALWRYAKNNDYAYRWYPLDSTETRTIDDIKLAFFALMVHEMAHAGDYAPPRTLDALRKDIPFYEALEKRRDQRITTRLSQNSPLASVLWKGLAEVWFGGREASAGQLALTAPDVVGEFQSDRANDDYSYHTGMEDVAMLTEEALMAIYQGVRRDFAIMPVPTIENPTSADHQVTWGQRGRIAEPRIKSAAAFALGELLPDTSLADELEQLEAPTPMTVGASWLDNLTLGTGSRSPLPRRPSAKDNRPVTGDIQRL